MQIYAPKKQGVILRALVEHGPMDASRIAEKIGMKVSAVEQAIRRFRDASGDRYIKAKKPFGKARIFETGDELQGVSKETICDSICDKVSFCPDGYSLPMQKLMADEELMEFININAPYLSADAMTRCLQISEHTMVRLVAATGIDLSPEAREPRAAEIQKDLGFLPLGTKVDQWLGGTCFHLPSDIPGVTRVTRHYAAADE